MCLVNISPIHKKELEGKLYFNPQEKKEYRNML